MITCAVSAEVNLSAALSSRMILSSIIMSAIYLAGQMIDMQVGFGSVNVLDATSNIQVPLTSNFYYMYIILIFLTLNGHFFIIEALFKSFQIIPYVF